MNNLENRFTESPMEEMLNNDVRGKTGCLFTLHEHCVDLHSCPNKVFPQLLDKTVYILGTNQPGLKVKSHLLRLCKKCKRINMKSL